MKDSPDKGMINFKPGQNVRSLAASYLALEMDQLRREGLTLRDLERQSDDFSMDRGKRYLVGRRLRYIEGLNGVVAGSIKNSMYGF
jgi:hypothetical protein